MSKSSITLKKTLAFFATIALMLTTVVPAVPLLAASGSIKIDPQFGGKAVAGCTFNLYQIATYDSDVLSDKGTFTLTREFKDSGVEINRIKTAGQQEAAAETLTALLKNATVYSSTAQNGSNVFESVPLGAYLLVQTAVPSGYKAASTFMVFLPSTDNKGNLVTEITAQPKLGSVVSISAVKVWNDDNYSGRPDSVEVGLYDGTVLFSSVKLSNANNWTYEWTDLKTDVDWNVKEINVPDGYTSTVSSNSGVYTITNIRNAVIDGKLTVTKVWVNDSASVRPSSVDITLYRNGEAYDSIRLSDANRWSHEWTGLDESVAWSIAETSTHENYTTGITMTTGGYIISNTYSRGGDPDDDPDDNPGGNPGGKPGDNNSGKPGDNTGGKPGDNTGGKPSDNTGGKPGDNTGGNTGDNTGGNTGDNTGGNFDGNPGGNSSVNTNVSGISSGGNNTINTKHENVESSGSSIVELDENGIPMGDPNLTRDEEGSVMAYKEDRGIVIDDILVPFARGLAPQTGLVRWPILALLITGLMLLLCSYGTERKRHYV